MCTTHVQDRLQTAWLKLKEVTEISQLLPITRDTVWNLSSTKFTTHLKQKSQHSSAEHDRIQSISVNTNNAEMQFKITRYMKTQ